MSTWDIVGLNGGIANGPGYQLDYKVTFTDNAQPKCGKYVHFIMCLRCPKRCLNCPNGWSTATIESKTRCLKDLGTTKRADQSANLCKSVGGKLPLPLNEKQNNDFQTEIKRLFPIMNTPHKSFILDLSDVTNEGHFVDSFGNQPSFTNWHYGEPNSSNNDEDFVHFYMGFGTWNDIPREVQVMLHKCPVDSEVCNESIKLALTNREYRRYDS